ncbi:MAG: iron ABC transporter permease [Alteromonadaceae bacterium]|nr:iron ABC transporter permease [Alteromonadaceae bacterium]
MSKFSVKIFLLAILCLASTFAALTIGPASISTQELVSCLMGVCQNTVTEMVVWQVRLPRVLVGLVTGIGLACAGTILQNITRNPLADPYLFGIVSGAALGATVANITVANQLTIALPLAAFVGALSSVILVVVIAKALQRMEQLLLTGIAVSFMFHSITQFLLYLGDPFATNRVIFWLMGSLARVEMSNFYVISTILLFALVIIFALHRQIDALLLGDESAASLGVNVDKLRLAMLAICAALTATIVAYCGGIGFVGLMVPHIVRQVIGVTTVPLIIGSALIGGTFLLWVDVIARSALDSAEIPIGIITSAFGSIFFLLIMYRTRNNQEAR